MISNNVCGAVDLGEEIQRLLDGVDVKLALLGYFRQNVHQFYEPAVELIAVFCHVVWIFLLRPPATAPSWDII